MPTQRRNIILVALFTVILGTLIDESGENLSEQAECLRVCGLVREERSAKTGVQVRQYRFILDQTASQGVYDGTFCVEYNTGFLTHW